jgi:hypothetical protein
MTAGNVRAMLAGRKWQTRRIITPALEMHDFGTGKGPVPAFTKKHCPPDMLAVGLDVLRKPGNSGLVRCPHGMAGDVVWIQENYSLEILRAPTREVYCTYLADGMHAVCTLTPEEWAKLMSRKTAIDRPTPGRFMYRSLSRIRRDLAEVRAELVQEITDRDAWAEGISTDDKFDKPLAALAGILSQYPLDKKMTKDELVALSPKDFHLGHLDGMAPHESQYGKITWTTARGAFVALWAAIHGPASWTANPAVWVLEFER